MTAHDIVLWVGTILWLAALFIWLDNIRQLLEVRPRTWRNAGLMIAFSALVLLILMNLILGLRKLDDTYLNGDSDGNQGQEQQERTEQAA